MKNKNLIWWIVAILFLAGSVTFFILWWKEKKKRENLASKMSEPITETLPITNASGLGVNPNAQPLEEETVQVQGSQRSVTMLIPPSFGSRVN